MAENNRAEGRPSRTIVLEMADCTVCFLIRRLGPGRVYFDIEAKPNLTGVLIPSVRDASLSRLEIERLIAFIQGVLAAPVEEISSQYVFGKDVSFSEFGTNDCFFVLGSRRDWIQLALSYQPASPVCITLGSAMLPKKLAAFQDGWSALLRDWA